MINEVARAGRAILLPLAEAFSSPHALAALFERAGHTLPDIDQQFVDDVSAALGLGPHLGVLVSYSGSTDLDDLLDLVDAAGACVSFIQALVAGEAVLDATLMPPPLNDLGTLRRILQDLLDTLVSAYVSESLPPLDALLLLTGIRDRVEPGPIRWSRVPELFDDPTSTLVDVYGWGEELDLGRLDSAMSVLASLFSLPITRREVRPALAQSYWPDGASHGVIEYGVTFLRITEPLSGEFGLTLIPIPDADGVPAGVLLAPVAAGGITHDIDLGNGWRIALSAAADLTGVVGVALEPSEPTTPGSLPGLTVRPTSGAGDFGFGIDLMGRPPAPDAWGFGGDRSPRFDLHGVEVGFAIDGPANALEPSLRAALRAPDGGPGLTVSLHDPDADGFMGWILSGGAGIDASLEIEVSPSGIRLVGGLGAEISIPIDKQFGPLYLAKADIGLGVQLGANTGVRAQATVTGNVKLGPLVMVADGIGVAMVVEAAPDGDGLFGQTDLRFEFVPPTAFGASFDSEIVSGGGFIEISPPRYSGILDLQVLAVGITVIGVVEAKTPDSPAGAPDFSLYLSVMTEFTPIPLAFGFTLNGVGGIIAFNRTMDTDALVGGLFAGELDHILYPDDPIADAPQILASIDEFFPIQAGATTFGPIVKIGWGIPVTLVTIDLGVLITFPDVAIALIGKVHIALPDESAPLLELNAQVLGIVDFAGPTIMILASINDSQVIGIQLAGEFAVYLDMGPSPYFMFSVGGTHPDWVAPAGLPAALHDLERLSASIVLSETVFIRVSGYFALTSNTVQFGGGLNFEASTRFLRTTYYAIALFEVDVLIVFNPFRIKARLRAGAEVRTDKRVLFGVMFTAQFEGPDPWFASGGAEFKFFGIKVKFPVEIGSRSGREVKPAIDVAADLAAALAHDDAWTNIPALESGSSGEVIRWLTFADEVRAPLTPQDAIELRQSVVPLNVKIAKFGTGTPADADEFDVGDVMLGDDVVSSSTVSDVFAPSLFFKMSESEKLTSPSFEHYDAGVSFGSGASVSETQHASVSVAHEQRIVGTVGHGAIRSVKVPPDRLRPIPFSKDIVVTGPQLELIRK